MLSRLSISNYALIEHLDFTPGSRLTIITGETGAGKSVMLGALSLLKGERADMKVIADKDRKAIVEAVFEQPDAGVREAVADVDPDWDGQELIIRREINPSGRSRAFVNDTPASLAQLSAISANLLDIHSQNSNALLLEQKMQLGLLDAVAHNEDIAARYGETFRRYASLRQTIRREKEEMTKNREQAEIIAFKLGQLDKLKPRAGELKKIEVRYETLSNSEEMREALVKARNALEGGSDDNGGAIEKIETARAALSDIDFTLWEEEDPEVMHRLGQCLIELKDIVDTIEDAAGMTEYNPQTLASLSKRMNEYYAAMKAFRADSDEALENIHKELIRRYEGVEHGDSSIGKMERQSKALAKDLKSEAALLSEKRMEAAALLEKEIEREARKLGLANLRFEVGVSQAKLSKSGGDAVEFRAAFNKNAPLLPIGDIASGGETARLMLAIKNITSAHLNLPTVIFDEIDTGVSGSIADKMGEMMMAMSRNMQIITITHLPQVAVKGERHFKVFKEDRADKTISDLKLLTPQEREHEIGRMLAGEVLDEAALANARSLLKNSLDK